jgi:hypothetical protein
MRSRPMVRIDVSRRDGPFADVHAGRQKRACGLLDSAVRVLYGVMGTQCVAGTLATLRGLGGPNVDDPRLTEIVGPQRGVSPALGSPRRACVTRRSSYSRLREFRWFPCRFLAYAFRYWLWICRQ